jgi:hypothetical protein
MRAATAEVPREALRALLADEVQHARMGWAYLGAPALGGRRKDDIAAWLPQLFDAMRAYWRAVGDRTTPAAARGHGCLPLERLEELVTGALDELAVPGFAHVGITVSARAPIG